MAASHFPMANGGIERLATDFRLKKQMSRRQHIKQKFNCGVNLLRVPPGPFFEVDRTGDWPGYPEPTWDPVPAFHPDLLQGFLS
jgi:hypothetical protein